MRKVVDVRARAGDPVAMLDRRPHVLAASLLLTFALPTRGLDVVSIAHSPTNPSHRFALQCGRSGQMKISTLADVGKQLPTVLLGAIEAEGRIVARKRAQYENGLAYVGTAKKVGGKKDRWLLNDVFAWSFSCRADCREVRIEEHRFRGSVLEFQFIAGGEGERPEGEPPGFAPQSTAESEKLTLRCEEATLLPPG